MFLIISTDSGGNKFCMECDLRVRSLSDKVQFEEANGYPGISDNRWGQEGGGECLDSRAYMIYLTVVSG